MLEIIFVSFKGKSEMKFQPEILSKSTTKKTNENEENEKDLS